MPSMRIEFQARNDPEGEARQQRQLVCGVAAADIERRIGFGKAKPLRVCEHLLEGPARRLHLRQNVIAGAVENSAHRIDAIGDQALPQCLDDRNAAGGGGLEFQGRAVLLRQMRQSGAVVGQQRLVRRDDMFSGAQSRLDQRPRRPLFPADQLDNHIGRAAGQRDRIVVPVQTRDIRGARLCPVARRNGHQFQRTAGALGEFLAARHQELRDAAADRSQPRDCNLQGCRHFAPSSSDAAFVFADMARKRFTLRAAWRMRCSFSTSAMRT